MKKKIRGIAVSLLGTILVAAFPALFMYFQNAGEAHFSDIVPVLVGVIGVGLVLYGIVLLLIRKPAKAALITFLFLMVFLNYTLIESLIQKLFPLLRYWHIVPILLVILLHVAWAICKWMPDDISDIITPVLSSVFIVLIVINGVMAMPKISTRIKAEQEAKRLAAQEIRSKKEMPNFYFILFDEYSSIPFMQKYYDYDNTNMQDKLKSLGFNISNTSHNECINTAVITANLFQLDYVAKYGETSDEKLFKLRSVNPVFEQLREEGYSIVSPAGASMYGLSDAIGKKSKAGTITGDDLATILLHNTVVYPVLKRNTLIEGQVIMDQLAYLKNKSNFAEHNQFTIAHINCPHTPFIFDSEGNIRDVISNSWKDLSLYLQQYIFISSEINEIADKIVHNDPSAIVWILSDHGARASSDEEMFGYFSEEDMTNFFSALYYQGETIDIEGLSGVNTFRLLMNKIIGTDYEMIPLPKGKEDK